MSSSLELKLPEIVGEKSPWGRAELVLSTRQPSFSPVPHLLALLSLLELWLSSPPAYQQDLCTQPTSVAPGVAFPLLGFDLCWIIKSASFMASHFKKQPALGRTPPSCFPSL